jgi:Sec-independent protein translocase protein TatA
LPNLRRIVDMLDKGLGLFKKAIQPFEEVVKRARESKKSRERKNTLRENKLSRKLSELVSENWVYLGFWV